MAATPATSKTPTATCGKSPTIPNSSPRTNSMPTLSQSGPDAQLALTWLGWADDDYLAARALLLNNLLVQGSAFSNTTVEKYFKTLFILRALSIPHTHNIVALYEQIKASGITLNRNRSEERRVGKECR